IPNFYTRVQLAKRRGLNTSTSKIFYHQKNSKDMNFSGSLNCSPVSKNFVLTNEMITTPSPILGKMTLSPETMSLSPTSETFAYNELSLLDYNNNNSNSSVRDDNNSSKDCGDDTTKVNPFAKFTNFVNGFIF